MAVHTHPPPAHVSTISTFLPRFPSSPPPNQTYSSKAKRYSAQVRCALRPQEWRESRRLVTISLVLSHFAALPNHVIAGGALDNYLKRKKLDPLEVYIPAVILTQLQIKDLEKTLDTDQPQYASYRNVLRSGPAASLRVNIRAVAQYASDAGDGKTASFDVDRCLRALEDLDSLFLRASRNDKEASVTLMKAKIDVAINALDSLLQTVPPDMLDKSKAIAEAYRTPEEEVETDTSDPEIKQLQSIL